MNPTRISRYPGLRSFERRENKIFNGRKRETDQLHSLVSVKSLVVLFARSGLGKSSLINAGLIPELEINKYYPVTCRLQDSKITPLEHLRSAVMPYVNAEKLQKHTGQTAETADVWSVLNACEFTLNDEARIPIIICDQFEEFFEQHKKDDRKVFTELLSDLVFERLPHDVQSTFLEMDREEQKAHYSWFEPTEVKILLSIRSDRLSRLNEMTDIIPTILNDRFELFPLSAEKAKAAINVPAGLKNDDFSTAPFAYDPDTVDEIVDYLGHNREDEVEPFQLQIICQELEERVEMEQAAGKKNVVVTPDYLGGKEGMDKMLFNFYDKRISQLEPAKRKKACDLLENILLIDGRRVSVAEPLITNRYKIDFSLLEFLLKNRLIRREVGRLDPTYEISHDTLVAAITQYQTKRETKEREAELEDLKRRRKRYLYFFYLVAVPIVAFLGYQLYQALENQRVTKELKDQQTNILSGYQEIEQIKREIEEQLVDLDTLTGYNRDSSLTLLIQTYTRRLNSQDARFSELYGLALLHLQKEEFPEAIPFFDQAIDLKVRDTSTTPIPIYYNSRGDAYYFNKQYQAAIKDFSQAIEMTADNHLYHFNRALARSELNQYALALEDLEAAILQNPDSERYRFRQGLVYQALADEEVDLKRDTLLRFAKEAYRQAIQLNNLYSEAYNNRGVVQLDLAYSDSARLDFIASINADSANVEAYLNLGKVYYEAESYDQAIEKFTQAATLQPNNATAYLGLGNCYFVQSDLKKAIKQYKKVIEINPNEVNAYNNLGFLYYQKENRNFNKSLGYFNKAIEIDPTFAIAYSNRAFVQQRLKRDQLAIEDAMKALELDPDLGDPFAVQAFISVKNKEDMSVFYGLLQDAIATKKPYNLEQEIELRNEPILNKLFDQKDSTFLQILQQAVRGN